MKFKDLLENKNKEEELEEVVYPNGVYISTTMSEITYNKLVEYVKKYLPDIEFNREQHCTLIYSKKPYKDYIEDSYYKVISTFNKFSKFNDSLVVEINSNDLIERNKYLMNKYKFISDYDTYKPHFTISYNAKDIDINTLPPIDFSIEFENEIVEKLKTDWKEEENKEDTNNWSNYLKKEKI